MKENELLFYCCLFVKLLRKNAECSCKMTENTAVCEFLAYFSAFLRNLINIIIFVNLPDLNESVNLTFASRQSWIYEQPDHFKG